MPRFVMLRNITPEFDFKVFFRDFKFQHDKKQRRENFNICRLNGENEEIYYIGVCQFEQYSDFYKALGLSGKDGITIEAINSFPVVDEADKQKSIDKEFAESEAIKRPRATYIYVSVNSNWVHPPRATPEKIFLSERIPATRAIILSNSLRPGQKMMVEFPGVGQNISQTRGNCSLSLQEILKKLRKLRDSTIFYLENLKSLYFRLKQDHWKVQP